MKIVLKERKSMKYVYYLLLVSCIMQGADLAHAVSDERSDSHSVEASFIAHGGNGNLEEIIIEPDDAHNIVAFDVNPDGPEDYAQHLAHILYGDECKKDTFCIDPFQKHLASLKENHRHRYHEVTSLIKEHQLRRKRGRDETIQIPQVLVLIQLEAFEDHHHEQSETIQTHESNIKNNIEKIAELGASVDWHRYATTGTTIISGLSSAAIILLSYFLGTTPTGCPQPLLNASTGA